MSLVLALVLLPSLGWLYPLYCRWPGISWGYWTQRPLFLRLALPFGFAGLSLHLLGAWRSLNLENRRPFEHFGLLSHLLISFAGAGLAGGVFWQLSSLSIKLAGLGYGLALALMAVLWLGYGADNRREALSRPWLPLWALMHSLCVILLFTPLRGAELGCWLLSVLLVPELTACWRRPPVTAPRWPAARLAGLALGGMVAGYLCFVLQLTELQRQQLAEAQQLEQQRTLNTFHRPALGPRATEANGFRDYWQVVGNRCNLDGPQPERHLSVVQSDAVRAMFDPVSGELHPNPALLRHFADALRILARAGDAKLIRFPFDAYAEACGQELPRPEIGTMQDLLLLLGADGIQACAAGDCVAGARKIFLAERGAQDLATYGQVVPLMVAYKVERLLISSLGNQLRQRKLSPDQWRSLSAGWRVILAGEAGQIRQILRQEFGLANQTLLGFRPEGPLALSLPVRMLVLPYLLKGNNALHDLQRLSDAYLAEPSHDPVRLQRVTDRLQQLEQDNPFANVVLIDWPLTLLRYREHQALLRGFLQYFALRAYQARQGQYPETLAQLQPQELNSLPQDPFTGRPFVYRRVGTGFRLYAQGPNQLDDGGDGYFANFVRRAGCSGQELVFATEVPENCRP